MVERLETAGVVLIGQTTASEFGGVNVTRTVMHGATHNPWQHGRTPGGSSGGSAAAVAGGLVTLATAGDGGGSHESTRARSRQNVAGCQIDLVPLRARELKLLAARQIAHALRIGGANDGLDARRVAADPRHSNGGVGYAALIGDAIDNLVELRILGAAQKGALKEAVLERRPRLHGNVFQAAVVQRAAIAHHCSRIAHVHMHAGINHGRERHTELQLIEEQLLRHRALQQLYLVWVLVADAEGAHFAGALQAAKGRCHFRRLHQCIRAVQQQHIQIVSAQALEAAIHRRQNVRLAEIKLALANAALALQHHLVAPPTQAFYSGGKHRFAFARTIHIRMVKEGDARIQCAAQQLVQRGRLQRMNAHAAQRDLRNRQHPRPDIYGAHVPPVSLLAGSCPRRTRTNAPACHVPRCRSPVSHRRAPGCLHH